jgi:hypothetical protein
MRVIKSTGPQENCPTTAPVLVETVGTIVVKSISETLTPGESMNIIVLLT